MYQRLVETTTELPQKSGCSSHWLRRSLVHQRRALSSSALRRRLKTIPLEEQTTERVLTECEQVKLTAPKKRDLLVDRLGEILAEQNVDAAIVQRVKTS